MRPSLVGDTQNSPLSAEATKKVHHVSATCPFHLFPCLLVSVKLIHDCFSLRPLGISFRVPATYANRFVDIQWIRTRTVLKDLHKGATIPPNNHHRRTVDTLLRGAILHHRDTIPLLRGIRNHTILNVCLPIAVPFFQRAVAVYRNARKFYSLLLILFRGLLRTTTTCIHSTTSAERLRGR